MTTDLPYALLADLVLALHWCIVAFVVGGVVLILVGTVSYTHLTLPTKRIV